MKNVHTHIHTHIHSVFIFYWTEKNVGKGYRKQHSEHKHLLA